MGQYVQRSGKTYYKADDGKLYQNYEDALFASQTPKIIPNAPQIRARRGVEAAPGGGALPGGYMDRAIQARRNREGSFQLPNIGSVFNPELVNFLSGAFKPRQAQAAQLQQATGGVDPGQQVALNELLTTAKDVLGKPQKQEVVAPVVAPAGTVQPGAIVSGLTPAGTVDYSQGDEYKAQMAQYRNLIAKEKQKEAEDLGMKIWMEKYGKSGLGLTGPNPLMQETANAPSGFGAFVPGQGPTPAVLQASEAPMKAFGQEVKTYFPGAGPEGFSPLDAQDQQQQATADQADMATTVKLPVRNRVQAFLQGGM